MAKTTASASGTNRNFATPVKKEHGHEHDADGERGDQGRHGNLLRAVQNGVHGLLALRQVAIDVLDFDGGVVDQNAHGQRQPAQRHDVDRFVQGAQDTDGDQDR